MCTGMWYILAMVTLSFTAARQHLAKTIRTCVDDYEHVTIRSRERAVVMLPEEEYNSWKETIHQLDTPANVRHLNESLREYEAGDTVLMTAEDLLKYMAEPEDEA